MCDKNKVLILKSFVEECIKFCYSENRQFFVNGGLKHNKSKDIYKTNRRHYNLQKVQCMIGNKKVVVPKKNIKKYCLIFHYNIRAYPMLGIGYVAVIWIPFICSACLRKMYSP